MPKIRRRNVPEAILRHLYQRIRERSISKEQLMLFLAWLEAEPEVPSGEWFKKFSDFTVCGEGELVKTFLTPLQLPHGREIKNPSAGTAVPHPADMGSLRNPTPPTIKPQQPYHPPPLPPRPGGGPSMGMG
jgi:hypothetical protein